MSNPQMINKFPGLREALERCENEVQQITGQPVMVRFKIIPLGLTVSELFSIVCEVCDVHYSDIVGHSRKTNLVIGRHLFCYFAITHLNMKLSRISAILKVHHTSVMHARDKVADYLKNEDELYLEPALEIESRLNSIMRSKSSNKQNEG